MLGRLDAGLAPRAALRRRREPRAPDAARAARRPSSSWRSAGRARPRSSRRRCARRPRRSDRLSRLAEDLLVLAARDDGRAPAAPVRVRGADELLDGGGAPLRARAPTRRDGGSRSRRTATGASTGDRLRLEQALGNLVDNALRHGSGSGPRCAAIAATASVAAARERRGRGFPPDFAAARLRALQPRRRRRASDGAAASASRSSTRSPARTEAAHTPRTARRRRSRLARASAAAQDVRCDVIPVESDG